ncbi:ABC-type tungstate transport system, periplasmic binding protein [Thermobrachium celere DSM 8682]|uniref:ABC-type tungstate transport system, periplasmic binding protein n=2 Tax=Thermobrachium TaxID=150333 RepID=R7RT76_9CLOT|nr:ABC-type tungstate transport system, periplasmic binding protein [Thermobrachium celere DSM 8682]
MKRMFLVVLLTLILLLNTSCTKKANNELILATTTSTRDSGLLDYILPEFEKEYGYKVSVIAVGTGQALRLGMDGNADVLLVHSKEDEERFVKDGHGTYRFDVMYNDFVLLGPSEDKAHVKGLSLASQALERIYKSKAEFVSRADESGTYKFEMKLWNRANIKPEGDWYIKVGRGMAETLLMASEKRAYTISDRATYLTMKDKLDLVILVEGSKDLKNQYGVVAVNPNKNSKINKKGAEDFINWILSDKTQRLIGEFGKDKFGESLFIPNAKR